jgi:hypothetical protein
MPQFARPDADTLIGNFQDQAGGTTNIFNSIDESAASDADFIRSPVSPVNEVYVCRLSDVTDPISSSSHIMRMRTANDVASGGETLNYTQQLRMTYVNEGSQGTLIASQSRNGVADATWTTSTYTLSGAEADAITDYTALFYRFVVNKP